MSSTGSPYPQGKTHSNTPTPMGSSGPLEFIRTDGIMSNNSIHNNNMNMNNSISMNSDSIQQPIDHTFQNVVAIPIKVTRDQSDGTASLNNKNNSLYSLANLNIFQNLPKETSRGVDDLTRMEMALNSNLPEEMKWSLKKYLTYSNKAPYMISLKNLPNLLPLFKKFIIDLKPLIDNFNKPIIKNDDQKNMNILQMGLNSLLILRNLAQDTESIQILVKDNEIKDFLLFTLIKFENNINSTGKNEKGKENWKLYYSNSSYFNELIHYTLDLMEAISSYIAPAKKDDLYFQTLVSILNFTKDRYMFISILRSLSRLLVRSKADEESAADNLDQKTLSLIVSQLLIERDSELITASFDFLYQYILPGNQRITELFKDKERFNIFCSVLPKLLSYNIRTPDYSILENTNIKLIKRIKPPAPTNAPDLDNILFQQILKLNEPMRSTVWLRCCFEPVQNSEFTQISLWRAYESKFSTAVRQSGRKLLPAVEFIKNVSNAFQDAAAMVVTDSTTGKKRFVIKGIQPRPRPVSIDEGERASKITISDLQSKFIDDASNIKPASQEPLPKIQFPSQLSDVSKAAAIFLCLISNDTKGSGIEICKKIKPNVVYQLADIPPLITVLSEYMDNTPNM